MLIRCQTCQAQFSLQDGLAAAGAKLAVECGRCRAVFEAAAPARPVSQRVVTPIPAAHKPSSPGVLERKVSPDQMAKLLRPEGPRNAGLWLAGAGVVAVALAVGIAGFAGRSRKVRERLASARTLLLRDDAKSLEQATGLFTEAARLAPGDAGPEGERAFALLLQAAALQDLAARLEPVKDAAAEREQDQRNASRRLQEGLAAAKAALEDDPEDPGALKAMALHAALLGHPDIGTLPLERAAKALPQDPWIAWLRARLELSGPAGHDQQDRALAALSVARQAEPRMLRAQVDVAAIAIDREEPGSARDVLAKVLEVNPSHERAKRLLSLLPPAP